MTADQPAFANESFAEHGRLVDRANNGPMAIARVRETCKDLATDRWERTLAAMARWPSDGPNLSDLSRSCADDVLLVSSGKRVRL